MSRGSVFFVLIGIVYLVLAYRDPPEAIAHFFKIPAACVFFPKEQRVKLGRIAVGVFMLTVGASIGWWANALWPRILIGIVAVPFLALEVAGRWKLAGAYVEADDAERRAQWQSFEVLKRDQRFLHLKRYLDGRYRTTFDQAVDAATYRILYVDLWSASWQPLLAQSGARARYVVAYLERRDKPARLHVSFDLETGICKEGEVGLMGWGGRIPLAPVSA
jgi:hypothetical protein